MQYRLIINIDPKRKLHLLPKRIRKEIGHRIFLMQDDLAGDVKKLKDKRNLYRRTLRTFVLLKKPKNATEVSQGFLGMWPPRSWASSLRQSARNESYGDDPILVLKLPPTELIWCFGAE